MRRDTIITYDMIADRFTGDMSLAEKMLNYYRNNNIIIQFDEEQFEKEGTYEKVMWLISEIKHYRLRGFVMNIVNQPSYWLSKGSVHHHTYPGGMAEHCYEVATLCLNLMSQKDKFKSLSKDLVIAGALLHDIGKSQIIPGEHTLQEHYSHAAIGCNIIWNKMVEAGCFTDDQILDLSTICLSHHTMLFPESNEIKHRTYESLLIHHCDELSATIDVLRNSKDIPAKVYSQSLLPASFR